MGVRALAVDCDWETAGVASGAAALATFVAAGGMALITRSLGRHSLGRRAASPASERQHQARRGGGEPERNASLLVPKRVSIASSGRRRGSPSAESLGKPARQGFAMSEGGGKGGDGQKRPPVRAHRRPTARTSY